MVNIISEISINHLGMIKFAKILALRSKEVGANFVKFKIKDVNNYYVSGKKYRGYDFNMYRASMELSKKDFEVLDEYCREIQIPWFSTIHDEKGLEFISKFNPPFYKVASMDATELEFLRLFSGIGKPLIVSTGGLNFTQIQEVVDTVLSTNLKLILNHCVSIYPTPLEQCNIGFIKKLRDTFEPDVTIGYSGHEEGWMPTLEAIRLGVSFVERHITLSRDLKIHHIDASLTVAEFEQMVRDIRETELVHSKEYSEVESDEYSFLKERRYQ